MKLFARLASERAMKGKQLGGQKWLDILINNEARENIFRIWIEDHDDSITLEVTEYQSGTAYKSRYEKAKRQKDDGPDLSKYPL